MDDQERTYLLAQINAVERSRNRWRLTALVCLGLFVLAILLQGGVNILQGYRAVAQMREAELRALAEEQLRAAQARALAEEQRREAEAQKQRADAERAAKQRK
jgi:hypothetical protein